MAMTNQEIFNTVRDHLLSQNKKSMREVVDEAGQDKQICAYRGDNGCKCAIGPLIKDEFYTADLEGHNGAHSLVLKALKDSGVYGDGEEHLSQDKESLLLALQDVHDNHHPEVWKAALDRVAKDRDLIP